MEKTPWAILAALMTLVSFVMVCVGCSEFGHSKLYQFILGEVALFTTMLYLIVSTLDVCAKRKLWAFHTGTVAWFASALLAFGYAIWLGK